jgi:hypothetical protein
MEWLLPSREQHYLMHFDASQEPVQNEPDLQTSLKLLVHSKRCYFCPSEYRPPLHCQANYVALK